MIKSLQCLFLLKKPAAIPLGSGIHISSVSLGRLKSKNAIPNEPGMRDQKYILQNTLESPEEVIDEHDLENDLDAMNIDRVYDEIDSESRALRKKLRKKITASKFFSPCPQPSMLTYNERLCIQYLHKEDPVQWDLKTLSESFPATVDTIKKILKSKRKITPEGAKKMDLKVQKNWERLAEGKLDADPHVLEHLKKFINRREILLEQIKNENFYLPKIDNEPTWNQGEISKIIVDYEKAIEGFSEGSSDKALPDGLEGSKGELKTSRDVFQEKIKTKFQNLPEEKDSYLFGSTIRRYNRETTLEGLEKKILKKAEKGKRMELTEKIILENNLGISTKTCDNSKESSTPHLLQEGTVRRPFNESYTSTVTEKETEGRVKPRNEFHKRFDENKRDRLKFKKLAEEESSLTVNYMEPDENTRFCNAEDVGKLMDELQNTPELEEKPTVDTTEDSEKKKIDFSDPERLAREKLHYDKEEFDIKNTAFWNNGRSSLQKKKAENEKSDLDGPVNNDDLKKIPKIFVLDPQPYPERIKIPKSRRGSGLTFRVKDCYYDDDGEFLYRVPGMTK